MRQKAFRVRLAQPDERRAVRPRDDPRRDIQNVRAALDVRIHSLQREISVLGEEQPHEELKPEVRLLAADLTQRVPEAAVRLPFHNAVLIKVRLVRDPRRLVKSIVNEAQVVCLKSIKLRQKPTDGHVKEMFRGESNIVSRIRIQRT